MLAALLDYPFASLVNSIEVLDGGKLKISREIEGGNKEMNEIDLPCVLSIQTGINEPRYVGMRGIRQVASRADPNFRRVGPGSRSRHCGRVAAKSETGGLLRRLRWARARRFCTAAGKKTSTKFWS
jgi:electron transfer flavoprotein beta subunit